MRIQCIDMYVKLTYNIRYDKHYYGTGTQLTPQHAPHARTAPNHRYSGLSQRLLHNSMGHRHLVTDARRDIEEETVTRLPSKAFDEFLKALDRPMPKAAKDLIEMEPDWI